MKRRIIALALCLCICLSVGTSAAGAAETETSGTCGQNLTWTLDSEGVLTISGEGKMENYGSGSTTPWADCREAIRSVIIEEGVTSVGDYAFDAYSLMKKVTLPSTLEQIGASAFTYCSGLTELAVPENVTVIETAAFRGCLGVTEFVLPPKLTCVEDEVFFGCVSLKRVTLPLSITEIGYSAFAGCEALQEISLPKDLEKLDEYSFSRCSSLERIVIPSGVSVIPYGCFTSCRKLESVTLPDGITAIEGLAFLNCEVLTEINLPKALTAIGEEAFFACNGLTEIYIPSKVSQIDRNVFWCSTSIRAFRVAEDNLWYASDEQGALISKKDAALVCCPAAIEGNYTIPSGVTRILSNAFFGCVKLTSVVVPSSVTEIDSDAISGFEAEISICFSGDAPQTAFFPFTSNATLYFTENAKGWTAPIWGEEEYRAAMWNGEAIPAPHTHSYSDEKLAPSCTERGCIVHRCAGGDYYCTNYVAALGHAWDEGKVTIVPTTEKEGVRTFTCSRCKLTMTEPIDKLQGTVSFKDVDKKAYYAAAVEWAVAKNITKGTAADTFAPNDTCTRGQIVTFLWRAAGEPTPSGTKNPFTDVKQSDYWYNAVLWAVEQGITTGTSATTFSPNEGCTRGQVATFLWRYENKPTSAAVNPFEDVKKGAYYYDAVLWAVEADVTKGTSATTFAPNDTCTRGQIVTFLYRDIA